MMGLNLATGGDTGYINVPFTGTVAPNAGATQVYRFAVNPAGTPAGRPSGNFPTVNGRARLARVHGQPGPPGHLGSWYYEPLADGARTLSARTT